MIILTPFSVSDIQEVPQETQVTGLNLTLGLSSFACFVLGSFCGFMTAFCGEKKCSRSSPAVIVQTTSLVGSEPSQREGQQSGGSEPPPPQGEGQQSGEKVDLEASLASSSASTLVEERPEE